MTEFRKDSGAFCGVKCPIAFFPHFIQISSSLSLSLCLSVLLSLWVRGARVAVQVKAAHLRAVTPPPLDASV